jgi:hypothetical protein
MYRSKFLIDPSFFFLSVSGIESFTHTLSLSLCLSPPPPLQSGVIVAVVFAFVFLSLLFPCGPGSSVGIATGYGLDGPGIESR